MTDHEPVGPIPPCPFDPPCWWCANPNRWRVIDGEIVRLEPGETWDDR